jgi:DNA-binding NarL/FixJ family response regulator
VKKILIVNNDPEMCCSLSLFLFLRDHYDVISVTNTEDVEVALQNIRIDLILADVDTPRGNILKTLLRVKEHFPEMPIVMTYLYFPDGEMEDRLFNIADACILKPLENEEVIRVIDDGIKGVSMVT